MQYLEGTIRLELRIRCKIAGSVIHFEAGDSKKWLRLDYNSLNQESKSLFGSVDEFYKQIQQCLSDNSLLILGSSLFIKIEYNVKNRKIEDWRRYQLTEDSQIFQKVEKQKGGKKTKVEQPAEEKESGIFVIDDKNRGLKHFLVNGNIIEKKAGLYFATVYGKHPIQHSTSLSFKIVSLRSKVMIGICTEEAKEQGSIETSELHIGYRSDGNIWFLGETSKAAPQFSEGDTITVVIDPASKEVSWLNGGKLVTTEQFPDWGEPQPIYPYVCMQSSDIVRIEDQKKAPETQIQNKKNEQEKAIFVIDDKNRGLKHFLVNGNIIEKKAGLYFATVYGKHPIQHSTSLSFKIVSLRSKVMIGICTEEAKEQGSIETSELHIGYRSDGNIWFLGETSKAAPQFSEGDTITVVIDPASKEVSWLNGGKLVTTEQFPDWGEPQPIYPYVCMQSSDIVQIDS